MDSESKQKFSQALEAFQDTVGEDDPVAQFLKKYGKLLDLAGYFIKGFVERAQQSSPQHATSSSIQPPAGWESMSPLEKMNRKYDGAGNITPWYTQGMVYEASIQQTGIAQGVITHQPVPMENTQHGQYMAMVERRRAQATGQPEQTSTTMQELNSRAENEIWDADDGKKEAEQQLGSSISDAAEVPRKDGQPATINEAIQQQPKPEQVLEQVQEEMMKDNQQYLKIIIDYFKNTPAKQFEKDLDNIDEITKKFQTYKTLLPVQARSMIKNTTADDLKQLITEHSPGKLEIIRKKKMVKKLSAQWNQLREEI